MATPCFPPPLLLLASCCGNVVALSCLRRRACQLLCARCRLPSPRAPLPPPHPALPWPAHLRSYLFAPKAEVLSELEGKSSSMQSDAENLRQQREAVELKMKETEGELREQLRQLPTNSPLVRRLTAVNRGG